VITLLHIVYWDMDELAKSLPLEVEWPWKRLLLSTPVCFGRARVQVDISIDRFKVSTMGGTRYNA